MTTVTACQTCGTDPLEKAQPRRPLRGGSAPPWGEAKTESGKMNEHLPGSIACYGCGLWSPSRASKDSDGVPYMERKVIAFGPLVANRTGSTTRTYILDCGHLVISEQVP